MQRSDEMVIDMCRWLNGANEGYEILKLPSKHQAEESISNGPIVHTQTHLLQVKLLIWDTDCNEIFDMLQSHVPTLLESYM